jgi:1-acyl-sn-glycerol-3-phosphate acyltransferase
MSPYFKLGDALRQGLTSTSCGDALAREIDEKIIHIPAHLNGYGYDPWGYSPKVFRDFLLPAAAMYRHYFRCITRGIENVPGGRCMLIGNHAGQVAYDGLMIMAAMVLEAEPPRLARAMGEYWLGSLPWLGVLLDRIGSSVGTPQTCADMLDRGECILAFPEGIRGMNKVYADAYQLQEFGLGFMRLALQTNTPIVPFSVVGSEEQAPSIANLEGIGQLIGAPAFPITLTWPWLGPLGMLPLPVRYHIDFGEPLYFDGDPNDEDEVMYERVETVKATIQSMIRDGLARRESIFF